MKLSPPASSSDLDAARDIARRLHEKRRDAERPAAQAATPVPARRPAIPPAPPAGRTEAPRGKDAARSGHPAAERPQRTVPGAPPVTEPPPLPLVPPPVVAPPRPTTQPAPQQARPATEPPPRPAHERLPTLVPVPPVVHEPAAPSWDDERAEASAVEAVDALSVLGDASALPEVGQADQDDDAIEIEETNASLEDIVGSADLPTDEEIVGPPDLEAGDHAGGDERDAYEPSGPTAAPYTSTPSPFDEDPSIESMSEELFDVPPAPSWGEVVENCLMIAHARGAMLVDPAGLVLASNGFWPEPGPEPIAKKLVAMMDKTLKDAPTRSVSAPVGAMHLTAWRVPLAEGLITVAFLGDTPLRAEARTPVDAEILRGAP